jgi:hypothetical protein
MRIGKWWLSPGRRTMQPRAFTVPWLWVERDPYSFRVVLWGGDPDRDVQVGSRVDRIRQANLNRQAAVDRATFKLTLAFRDALTPAVRELARQVSQTDRALREARRLTATRTR